MKYILIILFSGPLMVYGQANVALGVFGGLANSKFDAAGYSQTTAMPVGINVLYGRAFRFGLEASSNVASPYKYKAYESSASTTVLFEQSIVLHDVSMVALVDMAPDATVSPFVRGGAGGYFGYSKDSFSNGADAVKVNFDSSVGWNAGGGLNIKLGYDDYAVRFYVEGLYHSFKLKTSDNTLSFKANNWQVRGGFRFIF